MGAIVTATPRSVNERRSADLPSIFSDGEAFPVRLDRSVSGHLYR